MAKIYGGTTTTPMNPEMFGGSGGVIDQTYTPTSENAQSGKAVSQAIESEKNRADTTYANILKGSKTDLPIIALDDVSPIEHNLKVGVKQNLEKSGNEFNIANVTEIDNQFRKITVDEDKLIIDVINGDDIFDFEKLTDLCPNLKGGETINITYEADNSLNSFSLYSGSNHLGGTQKWDYELDMAVYNPNNRIVLPDDISNVILKFSGDYTTHTISNITIKKIIDLTTVKVSRLGKNLFDISKSKGFQSVYGGFKNTKNGNVLTVECTVAGRSGALELGTFPKGKYTLSFEGRRGSSKFIQIGDVLGSLTNLGIAFQGNVNTFTLSKTSKVWLLDTGFTKGTSNISNIQLECGSTQTDYEPYIEPTEYTPNADGTVNGVASLYPNTTLMVDTENVTIDCEYNRDINKAFAKLEKAILGI